MRYLGLRLTQILKRRTHRMIDKKYWWLALVALLVGIALVLKKLLKKEIPEE